MCVRLYIRLSDVWDIILMHVFSVHAIENAGVHLAIRLHILPEILAEVAHQASNRDV